MVSAELKAMGVEILNISDSNPTRHGLTPGGVVEALSCQASLDYQPDPRGLESARLALAARFGGGADSYFLSASTSEAYAWIFKLLCNPGDTVLVPKPGYPLFDSLAGLEAVQTVQYRLEYRHPAGWAIDLHDLKTAAIVAKAKAIVIINPNNPTGSYASAAERSAIVSFCAEHGIALIADEVFFPYALEARDDRLRFGGETACLTFALDGLSKLLCLPQMKLGWIRISGPSEATREAATRLELIADTYLSAGAPVMNALPALLDRADPFVRLLQRRLSLNLAVARTVFGGADSPFRVLRCDGGWTVLLEYPRFASEEDTVLGLLRYEHLAVQPGYFFDLERDGYLALSLILEPEVFNAAVVRLRQYLDVPLRLSDAHNA
jgi:aspartate/methionine/tyrosine aminotransferase